GAKAVPGAEGMDRDGVLAGGALERRLPGVREAAATQPGLGPVPASTALHGADQPPAVESRLQEVAARPAELAVAAGGEGGRDVLTTVHYLEQFAVGAAGGPLVEPPHAAQVERGAGLALS